MSRRNSESSVESILTAGLGAIATVVGLIGLAAVIAIFTALPVMWAWNAVIPAISGLPTIGFVQALWLSLLCSCLFKSTSSSSSK